MPIKERKKMESIGTDSATARTASPLNASGGMGSKSQKEMNEEFFARKGNENKYRPDGVAPSQGGKYGGFGSEPQPPYQAAGGGGGGALPSADEFQADPVAALTKGFGWFTSTVGKGAKTLNDGYIQPTAQKVRPSTYLLYTSLPSESGSADEEFLTCRSQNQTSQHKPASQPLKPQRQSKQAPRALRNGLTVLWRIQARRARRGRKRLLSRSEGISGILLAMRVRIRVRGIR